MFLGDGARPEALSTPETFPKVATLSQSVDPTPSAFGMFVETTTILPGQLVARQDPLSNSNGGNTDTDADTGNGRNMSVYYFVFFALLICIAVLCIYFVWRKRRNALRIRPLSRGEGYHRDVREWDTARHHRHYWNSGSRREQASREEGLNENGEAPPPYMPKEDEEMGHAGHQVNGQHTQREGGPVPGEPSIPLQTLSRDQAGLKPPGYEQSVQPVGSVPSGSRLP